MRLTQRHAFGRPALALITAGVALAGTLVGCSQFAAPAEQNARLSAAQGSDVVAPPSERVYEVTDVEMSSTQLMPGITLPDTITPTGFFVVGDGVITDAQFAATFGSATGAQTTATFELTQPTVLRRVHSNEDSLSAVGTVKVGDVEHPNSDVEFSLVSLDDHGAEVEVLLSFPAHRLDLQDAGYSVVVRLTFDAK